MDLSMWGGEVSRAHTAEVCGRLSLCTRAQSCIVDWLCVKRQEHTRVRTCIMQYIPRGIYFNLCVFSSFHLCKPNNRTDSCRKQTQTHVPQHSKKRKKVKKKKKKGKKRGKVHNTVHNNVSSY